MLGFPRASWRLQEIVEHWNRFTSSYSRPHEWHNLCRLHPLKCSAGSFSSIYCISYECCAWTFRRIWCTSLKEPRVDCPCGFLICSSTRGVIFPRGPFSPAKEAFEYSHMTLLAGYLCVQAYRIHGWYGRYQNVDSSNCNKEDHYDINTILFISTHACTTSDSKHLFVQLDFTSLHTLDGSYQHSNS